MRNVVLAGLAILFSACGGGPKPPGSVIARVDGEVLTDQYLRSQIPPSYADRISDEARAELVNQWVHKELLYQEGLRRGLDRDPIVATEMHEAEKEALAAALVEQLGEDFATRAHITDDSVRAFYEANKTAMTRRAPEVRASHILLPTQQAADSTWRRVSSGASFDSLAAAVSLDERTRARGGDMGYFTAAEMLPEIVEFVSRNAYRGALSRPIRTAMGWHVVKVTDIQPAGTLRAFADVADALRDRLIAERQTMMLDAFVDSLGKANPPEIVEAAQPGGSSR